MDFNFSTHLQTEKILNKVQDDLYEKCLNLSNKSKGYKVLTHLIGFGVAVSSAAIYIAMKVATFGEIIVKGFGNFIPKKWSAKSDWKTGLKQLFIELPLSVIEILVCPIYVIIGTTITTSAMLINPTKYTLSRSDYHHNRDLNELNLSNI